MQYEGPRPACSALDGIMDEIGDPAVELIKSLGLDETVERRTIQALNDIIMEPFAPGRGTGSKIRDYIYELNRKLAE